MRRSVPRSAVSSSRRHTTPRTATVLAVTALLTAAHCPPARYVLGRDFILYASLERSVVSAGPYLHVNARVVNLRAREILLVFPSTCQVFVEVRDEASGRVHSGGAEVCGAALSYLTLPPNAEVTLPAAWASEDPLRPGRYRAFVLLDGVGRSSGTPFEVR